MNIIRHDHWSTFFSKKKWSFQKLRFFWGRVYISNYLQAFECLIHTDYKIRSFQSNQFGKIHFPLIGAIWISYSHWFPKLFQFNQFEQIHFPLIRAIWISQCNHWFSKLFQSNQFDNIFLYWGHLNVLYTLISKLISVWSVWANTFPFNQSKSNVLYPMISKTVSVYW